MRYLYLALLSIALLGCDTLGGSDGGEDGAVEVRVVTEEPSPAYYFVVVKSEAGEGVDMDGAAGDSYPVDTPGGRTHTLHPDSSLFATQINNRNVDSAHIKVYHEGELLVESIAETTGEQAYVRVDGGSLQTWSEAK